MSSYRVYNIVELRVAADMIPVSFRTWNDHSKYAVSNNEKKPWICIGDINRAVSHSFSFVKSSHD